MTSNWKEETLSEERCLPVPSTKVPLSTQVKNLSKRCREPPIGTQIQRSRGSLARFATISISLSLFYYPLRSILLHCPWIGTLLRYSRRPDLNKLMMSLPGFSFPRWSLKSLAWEWNPMSQTARTSLMQSRWLFRSLKWFLSPHRQR